MTLDIEKTFANAVAGVGDVLTPGQLGGIQQFMSTVFDHSLENLQRGPTSGAVYGQLCEKIQCRIIGNNDPNALALPVYDQSYLGFYGGTATVVAAIVFAAMRSKSVWPELSGDVDNAEAFAPLVATLAKRRQLSSEPETDVGPDALYRDPRDERRTQLVSVICAAAWQFVLFHEFMHIARGHLDFATHELGLMMMSEASEGELESRDTKSSRNRPMLHAIELDADRWATALLADEINPHENTQDEGRLRVDEQLRCQIIALGILFEVFDWQSLPLHSSSQRRHPHPAVRLASALRSLVEFLSERGINADFEAVIAVAYRDLAEIGNPVNWTLMQVMDTSRNEIDEQISNSERLFDDSARIAGMQAMLHRKGIDLA